MAVARYKLWVRIDTYQTMDVYIHAEYDWQAKAIGEAQYGKGNVLGYTRLDE